MKQPQESASAVEDFIGIIGRRRVLTSTRAAFAYAKGNRFGGGRVLAVLLPENLVDMWRVLQVCVERDLIVIPQASNTGLTGGSGPAEQDYDRDVVILSTKRVSGVHLLNGAREAVSLAGTTLLDLEAALAPHGREPHSVIGSTSIGASVIGGIANNSGGSQIRKGPAFTSQALYARVDAQGQLELVNHLGIQLDDDPVVALERLQSGEWDTERVTPPPVDSRETDYAEHLREITDSPARFNADPTFLHEASGSAGKLFVFAVRTRTFPREVGAITVYIGTKTPGVLEELRRAVLATEGPLPISAEYMGRSAFDLAARYGKDTFMILKHTSAGAQRRLFALKTWANGVFSKLPFFGEAFADTVAQMAFRWLPQHLPARMREYRDRFGHHLLMTVGSEQKQATVDFLASFFAEEGHEGAFFVCTDDEARSAMLHRFGAASAATRYYKLHHNDVSDLIAFDVALRRDETNWLEVLPADISDQLAVSSYYGHFFCHVLHQDHVAKKGADPVALKRQMMALLQARGAALPAEHNYGRIYNLPPQMEEHFRTLDPRNIFNAGIGGTSPHKDWR